MNKNIVTLISSLLVSFVWLYFFARLPIFPACEGLACAGTVVIILFVHFIVIPIIFGILGAIFSKENRFKQAMYSLGISLLVSIAVFLPQYFIARYQNEIKTQQDIQEMKDRYYANPEEYKQQPF